ncbi:MAG: hypothetical protein HY690_17525 [Chloroflexi bacterium]|nr:hypothetical protein [Chloroflexota bacterium]
MSYANQPEWVAPLPDLSRPALSQRLRIGGRAFQLQCSAVQHEPPGEPGTDLVQFWVLHEGRPLTLADLGITGPLCSTLWSYLCSKVTEAVVDFYAPRPLPSGELNPRLGCWGYRPDLQAQGLQSDCALALVMGVSVATAGARPLGDDRAYLRRLRDALAESLAYWILVALGPQRAG